MSTYTKYIPKTIEPTNLNGWKEGIVDDKNAKYLIYIPIQNSYLIGKPMFSSWVDPIDDIFIDMDETLHYQLTDMQADYIIMDILYQNDVDDTYYINSNELTKICNKYDIKLPEFREID